MYINTDRILWQKKTNAQLAGPVLYWMHREHRVIDNWSLIRAAEKAQMQGSQLAVAWCLAPEFLDAAFRQFHFLVQGMPEIESALAEKNIPFFALRGNPPEEISKLAHELKISLIVTDFDPLQIKRTWLRELINAVECNIEVVDSRNIMPCWLASNKKEYAARTIRPKINKLLPQFLTEFPQIPQTSSWSGVTPQTPNWQSWLDQHQADRSVPAVSTIPTGMSGAQKTLKAFLNKGLHLYHLRNDPNVNALSKMSAYLHFGCISAQRVALEAAASSAVQENKDAFLEELIVRRELTDNFCWYEPNYDNPKGYPNWALETLKRHEADYRIIYSLEQLTAAKTVDPLWNAAQSQMVKTGLMHGYLRMYWAKQLLLWTKNVEEASKIAVYLNDRYCLDGRDSNGYVGIAWSLGGVHDRPWGEREFFGTVRSMTLNGAKRKFDVDAYCKLWLGSQQKLLTE